MKRSAKRRIFLFNKKGVELTMNTVIISILVVLVLVVVIGFFLGGTNKMKETIVSIFSGSTAGTDISIAIEQCNSYCIQAESWPTELKKDSPYCTHAFKLDTEGKGKADATIGGKFMEYYCSGDKLNVPCPTLSKTDCNKPDVIT